jgi:hypothetical protein
MWVEKPSSSRTGGFRMNIDELVTALVSLGLVIDGDVLDEDVPEVLNNVWNLLNRHLSTLCGGQQ